MSTADLSSLKSALYIMSGKAYPLSPRTNFILCSAFSIFALENVEPGLIKIQDILNNCESNSSRPYTLPN